MSEGQYPRMPKPKDKSARALKLGELSLETDEERNRREYAEETGDEMPAKKAKKAPEESMLAKLGRLASEASAGVSRPWSKLMKGDDEDER